MVLHHIYGPCILVLHHIYGPCILVLHHIYGSSTMVLHHINVSCVMVLHHIYGPCRMVLHHIYGSWIFMPYGAPPRFLFAVRQYLNTLFLEQWIAQGGTTTWPARSPDLNPLYSYL